jgi:hypothetical protein
MRCAFFFFAVQSERNAAYHAMISDAKGIDNSFVVHMGLASITFEQYSAQLNSSGGKMAV